MSSREIRNHVENNHSHVGVYKQLLKDKEQELQLVNNRLRRMLMAWNRGKLIKKTNWLERSNMIEELETLRMEVQNKNSSKSGNLEAWIQQTNLEEDLTVEDTKEDQNLEDEEKSEEEDTIQLKPYFKEITSSAQNENPRLKYFSDRPASAPTKYRPSLSASGKNILQVGSLLRRN
jgi:hypothetical protein